MAEFLEIVAGARHICDRHETCIVCPLENTCNIASMSDSAAKEFERQVLEWQKGHRPPTWAEYLKRIGVIRANVKRIGAIRANAIDCVKIASEIATARIPDALLASLNEYAEEEGAADD